MNVKELIECLSIFPEDATVVRKDSDGAFCCEYFEATCFVAGYFKGRNFLSHVEHPDNPINAIFID